MFRKFMYLAFFVTISGLLLTNVVEAELIGWWRLDEGSGTTVTDTSGAGHDGFFAEGNPEWVNGRYGAALRFDGDNKVEVPDHADFHLTDTVSLALWAQPEGDQPDYAKFFCKQKSGEYPYGLQYSSSQTIRATINASARFDTPTIPNFIGEWAHLGFTYDGANLILYKDGEEVSRIEATGELQQNDLSLSIGGRLSSGQNFIGIIDDVYLFNHALTVDEIQALLMEGGRGYPQALAPVPADGAMIEDLWVNLSWSPGDFAVSHDIYIGDDFDAVNEGAEGTFIGNQAGTFIVVGFPGMPLPDGLVPGATYYWRIDEVNDAEPNSPWKGDVWSFMVPPKKAYFPNPADGAESVSQNVNLSWTEGFGSKLHTVYFGDNFDDVNNATVGLPQPSASFDPGTLKMAKTYYWRVDEFDLLETHKGDVWRFTTEGGVSSPNPAKDDVYVTQTPVLTWAPGLGATHEIFFGTDAGALEKKASGNLGAETYEPGQLEWGTTYYWRVDEANSANADSPWTGPLWNFTTANFLIIDDMEGYNDLDPADPNSNRIFNAWIDGYGDPTNGSLVGYDVPPFAEQTIVYGGSQSMPLFYDNSAAAKSEATLTLTSNRDWTINGINTLTIWFRGDSANAADTLYAALNGIARVDNDNPGAATINRWTEWNIDLRKFADQGVNLTNVNSITLGLGSVTGGTGMMYFDDIRLYALVP